MRTNPIMNQTNRNSIISTSGIGQLVERLTENDAGDRYMWSTLVSVDWSRSDLRNLRVTATGYLLDRITKTELPPHDMCIPTTGWELQLLDVMPIDPFGQWIKRNPMPQEAILKVLKIVLISLTHNRRAFELEGCPETKACTIAGNLVCRMFSECIDLCHTPEIAKATAIIAYKIWTWTGLPYNQSRWSSYNWSEVGLIGTIFLCTFMRDSLVREAFKTFCAGGGARRWRCAVSWLEVRILMLESTPRRTLEDISDLVLIMFDLSEMSDVAAKSILDGVFPRMCISMLAEKQEVSNVYLSTSAIFIHGLTNGLDRPYRPTYTRYLVRFLQEGVLVLLRNVVLHTRASNEHPSYLRTWSFLWSTVGELLNYHNVPIIERAYANLPSLWDDDVVPASLEKWKRIVATVNLFAKGYRRFVRNAKGSICDNLECHLGNATKKQCVGCNQMLYCSRRCQSRAWLVGHKVDCEMYRCGVIQALNVAHSTRYFLAHVLAFMILLSKKRKADKGEGNVPVGRAKLTKDEDDLFQIFDMGQSATDKNTYSIRRLYAFASTIQIPTQFFRMLDAARRHKSYRLAAFALSNPPKERFYIFGLFKPSSNTPSSVLVPVKAIEVTGLDRFVSDEA